MVLPVCDERQGTVLTGTILSGRLSVKDVVELPELAETRKVKSMQMFHQPVRMAQQGDRLGVCVTNLDSKTMERGVLCSPGSKEASASFSIHAQCLLLLVWRLCGTDFRRLIHSLLSRDD